MREIKTHGDILAASNEIWDALYEQELSIEEANVLFKDLELKSRLRIKMETHKLRG